MVDRVAYDEFSLFEDNAREVGLAYDGAPVVRRERVELPDGRWLSGLLWGEGPPEIVLLHGGAQNAHTWDTVALALGRPLLALDLPGHGHSGPGAGGMTGATANAPDVATAIRALAPEARAVVGMSLGGLTTLALIGHAPELVRRVVLVDVTPGVDGPKAKAIADFVRGPATFASFDEILARTIEHNPTRTESSLRRGILHNAEQLEDGSWVWRYRRFGPLDEAAPTPAGPTPAGPTPAFAGLWDVVTELTVPALLVRGMRPQSVVDDADQSEWLRRSSYASVVQVQEAGHSLQGDTPLEFARIVGDFVPA
ncbi:MAG: putative hydrolase [Frankiales bacterium]|nr:putative hydrolase [Frankiales bacterium]